MSSTSALPPPILVPLPDEAATMDLGQDIAAALRVGDCVYLVGDLGAGKTTLARALIRSAACDPRLTVPSPTFTLVENYTASRLPISHADLYRLNDPEEVTELGLGEALEFGALLIEWPEQGEGFLPPATIQITLATAEPRCASIVTQSAKVRAAIERSLAIRAFLEANGFSNSWREPLAGDASHRAYETIRKIEGEVVSDPVALLMNAPADDPGPAVRDGLPYTDIAHIALDIGPFVAIDQALRAGGFCAPEIYAAYLDQGLLLIEPLGRETLVVDGAPVGERYQAAAELLATLHSRTWPDIITYAPDRDHIVPPFEQAAVLIEVELALDWYLPQVVGREPDVEERIQFQQIWADLAAEITADQSALVLRDFHSPNLIWRGERTGTDRLGLIDFQDALIGPPAYDLASLGQDARVTISTDLEADILSTYIAARSANDPAFDEQQLRRLYAILCAQRGLKVIGIFARLNYRDGKPAYLAHLPRIRGYLRRTLEHPALGALKQWCTKTGFLNEPA